MNLSYKNVKMCLFHKNGQNFRNMLNKPRLRFFNEHILAVKIVKMEVLNTCIDILECHVVFTM